MANLYYLEDGQELARGKVATLDGDEARHAVRVARIGEGERVLLGDRKGVIASASARTITRTTVEFEVQDIEIHNPSPPNIVLVQALAKGGRDELAIQMCTELGIDQIIPWQAARSIPRWNQDKSEKGLERWRKIVLEASKQSIRPTVPNVVSLKRGPEVSALGVSGQVVLLDSDGEHTLRDFSYSPESEQIILIVGPEGGVTDEEKRILIESGARDVRLGTKILRTSTAGAAALSVINSHLGRF